MADTNKTIRISIETNIGDTVKKLDDLSSKTKEAAFNTNQLAKESQEAASGVKGLGDVAKAVQGLGDAASVASVAMGVFTGSLAKDVVEAFGAAIGEAINQIIDLGAKTQKTISQISAMKNFVGDATAAYREFNDVGRNTNFDLDTVQAMGAQLLNMGYSAKNAAELIQLCADTAAGLNAGQAGAQQLVDVLSRIQSTGEMSSRQLISLQMAGMDLDKAFASVGMSAEKAMKAMDEGTLDAQTAIKALTDYMHEFDGSMEKSKNNVTDRWSDVCGNMQTIMGEIGAAIFDAFNQSEIIQTLTGFTQDLIDLVRGGGCGAFDDFKGIATTALDAVNTGLNVVTQAVKAVIVGATKLYAAFRTVGAKVANALSPILQPLSQIWNFVKSILSSLGQSVSEYVGEVWTDMFWRSSGSSDDWDLSTGGNRFREVKHGKETATKNNSVAGGSGGRSLQAITEEQRAIEALIKKYSDADKARYNSAKASIELAKINLSMLVGETKETEERRIKLWALEEAHNELIDGYNKELLIASKINDEGTRKDVINGINRQIDAENRLYEARVRQVNFDASVKAKGKESEKILDKYFGTQDEIERKIKEVQGGIAKIFKTADYINSGNNAVSFAEGDLGLLAEVLKKTPEALQEELDAKNQSLATFISENKERIANATKELMDNKNAVKSWGEVTVRYATMVGDAMADSMYSWITGAKSGKDALADFVSSILKTAAQLLTRWLSLFAIFSIVGDPRLAARNASAAVFGAYNGNVSLHKSVAAAAGGYITGSGTSVSDSIPAMLSNGEYVIKAAAVRRIGVPTLNAINTGRYHFADGGYVGGQKMQPAAPVGGNITLQVNTIDASDFDSFLNFRGGGERITNMLREAQRRFAFSFDD